MSAPPAHQIVRRIFFGPEEEARGDDRRDHQYLRPGEAHPIQRCEQANDLGIDALSVEALGRSRKSKRKTERQEPERNQ
jgi:hypothetical protein